MAIEIKEIIVRTTVSETRNPNTSEQINYKKLKAEILNELKRELKRQDKRRKER